MAELSHSDQLRTISLQDYQPKWIQAACGAAANELDRLERDKGAEREGSEGLDEMLQDGQTEVKQLRKQVSIKPEDAKSMSRTLERVSEYLYAFIRFMATEEACNLVTELESVRGILAVSRKAAEKEDDNA